MSIFDVFKSQNETIVLNSDDQIQKILEVNSELESLATQALMKNKPVSWHDVRNRVNSNARADQVCKNMNDLGIPIIFRGQIFNEWVSWD